MLEEMAMLRADLAGLRHVSVQKEELVSMQEEIIMLRAEVSDLKHLLQLPKVLEYVNEADTPTGAAGAGGKNVVQAVVATSSIGGQAVAVTNILVEGLSVPPVAAGLAFPIPLAVNKVPPVAKQQCVDTAELATLALAKRKPKFNAKLKVLLERSAKAGVVKEVMWIFGDLFDASIDDDGLLEIFVDLFKMVKLFAFRGLGSAGGDLQAALHECLGAVI